MEVVDALEVLELVKLDGGAGLVVEEVVVAALGGEEKASLSVFLVRKLAARGMLAVVFVAFIFNG